MRIAMYNWENNSMSRKTCAHKLRSTHWWTLMCNRVEEEGRLWFVRCRFRESLEELLTGHIMPQWFKTRTAMMTVMMRLMTTAMMLMLMMLMPLSWSSGQYASGSDFFCSNKYYFPPSLCLFHPLFLSFCHTLSLTAATRSSQPENFHHETLTHLHITALFAHYPCIN